MNEINLKINKISITKQFINFFETAIADEIILSSFLRKIEILFYSSELLHVGVNSSYAVQFLDENYKKSFSSASLNILGRRLNPIFFEISKYKNISIENNYKQNPFLENKKYDTFHINKKYNFFNYVSTTSNKEAIDASFSVIKDKGKFNPLFIYSNSGFGKTHLLHSIGNKLIKLDKIVYYISPNQFTNEVRIVMEKKGKYIEQLKNKYSKADYLLIDDIQFLSNRIKTMDVFFDIFNNLISSNNQLIIASDKNFNELGGFEDRYLSRFGSGLVLELKKPSINDFEKIIIHKIKKNVLLSARKWDNSSIKFLAENNNSNIRTIESSLNRVEFLLPSYPKEININKNILKEMFKDVFVDEILITPEKIINEVCKYYGVLKNNVCGKSRKKELIIPRHVSMYLCRKINKLSLVRIGLLFGGRDHSTIINAINKINYYLKTNKTTNIAISTIENNIRRMT